MIVGVGVGVPLDAVGVAVGVGVTVGDGLCLRVGVDHSISSSSDIPDAIAVVECVVVPVLNVAADDDVDDVIDVEVELTVAVGLG